MVRKPASSLDVALVLAAAEVAAKYASHTALSKLELTLAIADIHALLVDRVDNGPRASFAGNGEGDAEPFAQTALQQNAGSGRADAPMTVASPVERRTVEKSAGDVFRADWIVSPPIDDPFLPIDSSVQADAITCLVCGNPFATLKRHLLASHKLSDTDYRKRYGLSAKYPMICEQFKTSRQELMKESGAFRPLTKEERATRKSEKT